MQHKKLTEITVESLISQIEKVGQDDLQKTQRFFNDQYHLLMDHELFNQKQFRKQFTDSVICLNYMSTIISTEDLQEIEQCLLFLEGSMMLLITHELFDSMDYRIEYCNATSIIKTLMEVPTQAFAHP
jgi:hypothetical protein